MNRIQEIADAYDEDKLNEVFGAVSQMLYDTMTGIQWGKIEDTFGWTVEVK